MRRDFAAVRSTGRCLARALPVLAAGLALLSASQAVATHERATSISWVPIGGTTIEFSIKSSWRRTAYSTSNSRCRNPNGLAAVACTGPGGFAGVGDLIVEQQGGTQFNPGDGSGVIGSPLGPLLFFVTSIDSTNNWLFGEAVDAANLPTLDTTISHVYPATGNFTAFIADCCRISNTSGAGQNAHINNPDGSYRIGTLVNVGSGNRPPVSSMPPIVLCPVNGPCAFMVPASDPDGDTLTYRLSTAAEASSPATFNQPGQPQAPNESAISTGGTYSWNTTGATLGGGGANTYYSTQIMIEDRDAGNNVKSRVAVDFLLQLVPQAGVPPVFDHPPTPACGAILPVDAGDTLGFTVQASDADFGQTVTINVAGLPSGATMTPTLPASGNPVSSAFSWTPTTGQAGTHVVTFDATDTAGLQTLCSVTITVPQCQTNGECNDNDLCTTDTCDPGNPSSDPGGCVRTPVICADCQVCDPGLGCTGAACTATATETRTITATATATHTVTTTATVPTATITDTPTITPTPAPCGNGGPDPGEECDDGNGFAGDGCEPDCTVSAACNYTHGGSATERFVGGCGAPNFADIQSAINASSDGDIVSVCPGTYTQPVSITREITLQSTAGAQVTIIHTNGIAVNVRRSGVRVEQLTLISDTAAALGTASICPLAESACASPGQQGSNLAISNSVIRDSVRGIDSRAKIDCLTVSDTDFADNQQHALLRQEQLTATPANLVALTDNTFTRGGEAGYAVEVFGMRAQLIGNRISESAAAGARIGGAIIRFAQGIVEDSTGAGIVVDGGPTGTQVLESEIRRNGGDGITIKPGSVGTRVQDNNITENTVGLGNEAAGGQLDATLNWWNSPDRPERRCSPASATAIVNRSGATTLFIEFLCKPFPQGFPSESGVCSIEVAELRQLVPGTSPDIDPSGGFVTFAVEPPPRRRSRQRRRERDQQLRRQSGDLPAQSAAPGTGGRRLHRRRAAVRRQRRGRVHTVHQKPRVRWQPRLRPDRPRRRVRQDHAADERRGPTGAHAAAPGDAGGQVRLLLHRSRSSRHQPGRLGRGVQVGAEDAGHHAADRRRQCAIVTGCLPQPIVGALCGGGIRGRPDRRQRRREHRDHAPSGLDRRVGADHAHRGASREPPSGHLQRPPHRLRFERRSR